MKSALFLLALVSCGPADPAPQAQADRSLTPDDRMRFLAAAIFEGLHEDWPDVLPLQDLLDHRDTYFVLKCPTCAAVAGGIDAYLHFRSTAVWPYQGKDFPKELADGLRNPDRPARLKAIEGLVKRYVDRRFGQVPMRPGEKEQMRALLEEGKRFGMSAKEEGFGDFCPSCSGATKR